MLKIINGDLLKLTEEGQFNLIAHGCNCFHTMGSGIALAIKNKYPEVILADNCTGKGDRSKLGTFTHVSYGNLTILNCYTQFTYGRYGRFLDYEALEQCLITINKRFNGMKLGLPLIGGGRAGGEPIHIIEIMSETLTDIDATLVLLKK